MVTRDEQERHIGESSAWWPYISTLPINYCQMPLFWNDTQLQWLQVLHCTTDSGSLIHHSYQ
jgi:hypothetical protein